MKKNLLLFFAFVFPSAFCHQPSAFAQDARPYFQQEVSYKINVTLNDKKHELAADESLEYINNSPDDLTFIWFHLWPNGYKNNNTPLGIQLTEEGNKKYYFASPGDRGYIDQLDFKVNGQSVKTENGPSIDMCKLILNEPLKPGAKITITTPFHVKVPIGIFSRLGHIGQQYQITQWYPKPAVYDKYGWHNIPYLNQGEFYSEFGSFDVSITLPKNYVLGATGTMVNGEEETAWLMKNAEETKAIEKYNPHDTATPASSPEMKTLRFQASNVHDFGWFADKRYHVLHDVVELPHSKNKVDTWVMFTNLYGEYWKKAAKYVSDAVYYYSLWNGDYPYPHATAVDGALSAGGGMEYPMITVIGGAGSDNELDRVIAHEVGHNWFYGILGSNERDHAWMDEGINSFNENRYMEKKYPKDSVKSDMQANIGGLPINIGKLLGVPNLDESTLFDLGYRFNAVRKLDQPVDMTSSEYTSINYGTIVYGKTAVILAYLQAYLGEEMYDKCAQAYFEKWKFHHPYPPDIKKVYEEVSGKDLSWFFKDIIQTTNQVDYKICSAKKIDDKNLEVKIKNKGKISSPFSLSTTKDGKIISTQWYDGLKGKKTINFSLPGGEGQGGALDILKIDAQNKIPDINRQNNTLKMKGLFKKMEPLNIHMFGVVNNTDKTQLFWAPVVGWNEYDHFMFGALFYNNLLIEKKLEWQLMPMYSYANKDLAGGASIHYNIHPNSIFQTIRFGVNGERYAYSRYDLPNLNFNKITPDLTFELKRKHLRSTVKQTLRIRQVNIFKEVSVGDYSFSPPVYQYDTTHVVINDFTYSLNDTRKIYPYNVALNVQEGESFVKSAVTANYKITFKKKDKALDIRFYAGYFIDATKLNDGNYFFNASGSTGAHDYLYDNVFLGRSEASGFMSHQFVEAEGNMKVYTPLGKTNQWLGAINLKCPLPGKLRFKLFADINIIPQKAALREDVLYDAGIYLPIIKNYIEVYIPLLMSNDMRDVFYLNNPDLATPPNGDDPDKYGLKRTLRMIRFTFNIHQMNPFNLVRNLSL